MLKVEMTKTAAHENGKCYRSGKQYIADSKQAREVLESFVASGAAFVVADGKKSGKK